MHKFFILFGMALTLSGCMYKSVMKDEADNINKSKVYSFGEKHYLVMLESVYQAVSKESRGGSTRTVGFNEQRISVYDLDNGSLLIRKKTGKQIKDPIELLGCTADNIWFYSVKNGIHSLDPESLEIKVTQASIFEKNPEIRDNLAECEWYELSKYFQFNDITGNITLTDKMGVRYILDAGTLKASKINTDYRDFDPRTGQNLESYISYPPPVMELSGDLRKHISIDRKDINPEITFLDGKFIVDRDPSRIIVSINELLSSNITRLEKLDQKIIELKNLNGGNGPSWGTKQRDILTNLEADKRKIERVTDELKGYYNETLSNGFCHRYVQLLSPDTTTFFVFHKSNTAKDASFVISRLQIKDRNDLKELWNTEIQGIFFDPSAARETSSFKEVFSKGNPEFGYSLFDTTEDKLIIIWMLHVCCLDIESGKLLWKFRI